jgi:hypothetical protein
MCLCAKPWGNAPRPCTHCPTRAILVCPRYTGQLKSEPLVRLLDSFAGGKRCSKETASRLTVNSDLSIFTAVQLREMVKERGLECRGCSEKADFVQRLREHLRSGV